MINLLSQIIPPVQGPPFFNPDGSVGARALAWLSSSFGLMLSDWSGAYLALISTGIFVAVVLGLYKLLNRLPTGLDKSYAKLSSRERWQAHQFQSKHGRVSRALSKAVDRDIPF